MIAGVQEGRPDRSTVVDITAEFVCEISSMTNSATKQTLVVMTVKWRRLKEALTMQLHRIAQMQKKETQK